MMTQRLLIAVPTYNRPKYISELIAECAPAALRHDADIIIYDSGETDATQTVVEGAIKDHPNVSYIRLDPTVQSNQKIIKIMQGFGWEKTYDYVWVWGDSIRYTDAAFSKVDKCMEAGRDLIITDIMNSEGLGDGEYDDAQKLFDDLCWYMTLYGGVVIRKETMLDSADWETIVQKYMTPDTFYYCQIGLYFEQILRLPSFTATHLALSPEEGYARKREDAGWFKDRIEYFCINWVNTIQMLPDAYRRKDQTIMKYPKITGAFSNRSVYMMKMDGILDWKKYREYKDRWPLVVERKRRFWLVLSTILPKWMIYVIFQSGVCIKSILRKAGLIK